MTSTWARIARDTLATVTLFAWALWLGGLITLFASVQALFGRDRALAAESAPVLFATFERYQLVLAAVAVVATVTWLMLGRQRLLWAVLAMVVLATAGAVASPLAVTRKMEHLRAQGQSHTAEFRRLHGQSMMIYVGETAVLAVAGVMLPVAIRRRSS